VCQDTVFHHAEQLIDLARITSYEPLHAKCVSAVTHVDSVATRDTVIFRLPTSTGLTSISSVALMGIIWMLWRPLGRHQAD
jgi:hypothetical protein